MTHSETEHGLNADALFRQEEVQVGLMAAQACQVSKGSPAQVAWLRRESQVVCGTCMGLVGVESIGTHLLGHPAITGGLICPRVTGIADPGSEGSTPGNLCSSCPFRLAHQPP